MEDTTLATKKELEEVEQSLQETAAQIQLLLNKQSALQEKRSFLKKHLKALTEQQNSAHDWTSEGFDWSTELREKREQVFGIKSFRPHQLETINTTMSGLDCILVMPTGAGKSLCYQLPALLKPGLTLVISPLVSLIEDQVMSLQNRGVAVAMLNASSSKEMVNSVYADMVRKPCKLRLLYVTPEKLAKSKRFMNKLEQCNKAGLLSRIAIDEVHCCSQWGHDFRPDYKFLGILKKQYPQVPILGLTATASSGVLADVQKILHLPHAQIYKGSFNRKNLTYSVIAKPAGNDECMRELHTLIQSKFANQSGIIYCFSRKDTVSVAEKLGSLGIACAAYHADLDPRERSNTHTLWLQDKIRVIVATIAFGMGIDKPDVRFVIHHSLSKSMENYYQESGRAGRDDLPAECILMYRLADVYRQSCMVFSESTGLEKLYGMVKYCVDKATCRRTLMAQHFSEVWSEMGCNGACDHCKGQSVVGNVELSSLTDDTCVVYEILDKARQADTRLTGQKLLDAMVGKGATQHRVSKSANASRNQCEHLIATLLVRGQLREEFHFTPYSTISYVVVGDRRIEASSDQPRKASAKKRKVDAPPKPVNNDDVIVLSD